MWTRDIPKDIPIRNVFIIINLVDSFKLILMSSTYLRGLEVAELKEEYIPTVLLVWKI